MPTTTSRGFPIPLADGSDPPNVHTDIRSLGIYADGMFITVANSGALPAAGQLGRRALATADNTIWLDIATGWIQEGIPLVTAFPGTPKEGQVIDYQTAAMATDNVIWRFRRVGSNWIFVGGSGWHKNASSTININAAANVKIDITDPVITVPFNGVFEVEADAAVFAATTGTAEHATLYVKTLNPTAVYTPLHMNTYTVGTGYRSIGAARSVTAQAGDIRLAVDRAATGSIPQVVDRGITVRPVYTT